MKIKKRTILQVMALARNCAPFAENFSTFLSQIKIQNVDIHVLIGENGSTDNTRDALAAHFGASAIRYKLVDTSFMAAINDRLERMAQGRERLRQTYLLEFEPADFILVCDVDNVFASIPSGDALIAEISKLNSDQQCFAVSATSRPYYDLFALESPEISDNFLTMIEEFKSNALTYRRNMERYVYSFQESFAPSSFKIISAFNGMCLYRSADYIRSSYLQNSSSINCEHVVFNRRLHYETGCYMRISDALVVQAPAEHIRSSRLKFLRRYVSKRTAAIWGHKHFG